MIPDELKKRFRKLPEPLNLYKGTALPANFALPDNILIFYHDYCAPAPSAHHRYTLVFPLANMRYCLNQAEYEISEGDVLLIRPYCLRFLAPESRSYQRFFITFQLPLEQEYLPENPLMHLSDESVIFLQKILDIYQEGNNAELAITLYKLLTTLPPNRDPARPNTMSDGVARALAYINQNLNLPLDNNAIAAQANMSISNLARRFKAEVGTTIRSYIQHQHLEFARYYLQKTAMQIDEIAEQCGFLSSSSFSHFFKKATGLSPLEYRKEPSPGKK